MMSNTTTIQHPEQVQLKLTLLSTKTRPNTTPCSLYLACNSNSPYQQGQCLQISYPSLDDNQQTIHGYIQSCQPAQECPHTYQLVISFYDTDNLMQMRMLEQQSCIQLYQRELSHQGRPLNIQQAALEWIERYAAQFPAECV